jgi:hypothetical protein
MFSFKWNETSCGRCVDEKENTYSYGAYYNIPSYEECAKTCLNKMDQLLLEDQQDGSGSFRGIDYVWRRSMVVAVATLILINITLRESVVFCLIQGYTGQKKSLFSF